MIVTLKFGINTAPIVVHNVKDVIIYPDGDKNTTAYVSILLNNRRFHTIYQKPQSISISKGE